MKQNQLLKQLNWRSYIPADEREQALYHKAFQVSYRTLVGLFVSTPFVYGALVYTGVEEPLTLIIILIAYVALGVLLTEGMAGTIFNGQDISFTKPQVIRKFDADEKASIAAMFAYLILFPFTVFAINLLTHLQ